MTTELTFEKFQSAPEWESLDTLLFFFGDTVTALQARYVLFFFVWCVDVRCVHMWHESFGEPQNDPWNPFFSKMKKIARGFFFMERHNLNYEPHNDSRLNTLLLVWETKSTHLVSTFFSSFVPLFSGHDSLIHDMIHLCVTWNTLFLVLETRSTHCGQSTLFFLFFFWPWVIDTWYDAVMCDMIHLCVTWLIRVRYDSFIHDVIDWKSPDMLYMGST